VCRAETISPYPSADCAVSLAVIKSPSPQLFLFEPQAIFLFRALYFASRPLPIKEPTRPFSTANFHHAHIPEEAMAKKAGGRGRKARGANVSGRKKGPARTTTDAVSGETPSVPADARGLGSQRLNSIQIGNRRFFAHPTTLATPLGRKKLDILPDMPDIRDPGGPCRRRGHLGLSL
jgi:hypothetical protein